jgi:hypothetical protein
MFVSSFLALAASSPDLLKGYSFEAYESEFQRKYTVEERPVREAIFLQNLASIIAHNEAPQSSWHRGIGDLTDRTPDEIREILPRGFDKAISVQERLRDGVGQKQVVVFTPQPIYGNFCHPLPLAVVLKIDA